MAGHSKWANIKFRKAAQDKKRGKIFTKLIRAITVAAQIGGGDPNSNPRLRDAITKALSYNMTKDTIERARKKGVGDGESSSMEEILYEGYGTSGVAVMVYCLTDNRNRTVSEVRHAFSKHGGNLGTSGSVAYLFKKQGQITFSPETDGDRLMEVALEAGAEDITTFDDGSTEVQTDPDQFSPVYDALIAAELKPEQAEISLIASTYVPLNKEDAEKLLKLQDALEDLDDVQEVHTNAEMPSDLLED